MTRVRSALFLVAGVLLAAHAVAAERVTLNFNPDWRFIKDDPAGAQEPDFDDQGWPAVSMPHTYNDVDTFDNWSTPGHRGEQIQWAGRTWYRKTFHAPDGWKGKKVFIEFEGARQVAEVYVNGRLLGVSKTGFTPFGFDLTPHLKIGAVNVIAVMVDNRFMQDPLDAATQAELARRNAELRNPGTPELRNSGTPELRNLGTPEAHRPVPTWRSSRASSTRPSPTGSRICKPTRSRGTTRTGTPRTAAFTAMCGCTSPIRCTFRFRSTAFSRRPGRTPTPRPLRLPLRRSP